MTGNAQLVESHAMLLFLAVLSAASVSSYPSVDSGPCATEAGRAALLAGLKDPAKDPVNQRITADIASRKAKYVRDVQQLAKQAKWTQAQAAQFANTLYDDPRHQALLARSEPLVRKARSVPPLDGLDDVSRCQTTVTFINSLRQVGAVTTAQWDLLDILVREKAKSMQIVLSE